MKEPSWGPTGKQVFERTYSRAKADGAQEEWVETVSRVVDGNLALVDSKYHEKGERSKLVNLLYDFKALPAGRHLWMSGVPGRAFLFNCHHSGWTEDITKHFTFTFNQLMQGGGVGANYSNRLIKRYKPVKNQVEIHIVCDPEHHDYADLRNSIMGYAPDGSPMYGDLLSDQYSADWAGATRVDDSREGWTDAVATLLHAFWGDAPSTLVFDVSNVRHSGSRIRSFGGTAAGPGPLAILLLHISELLNGRVGNKITSLDAMLIDHFIATCVVSGNVRRSARMSIKCWSDPDILDFVNCKSDGTYHWSTNISVEIDDHFFKALKRGDENAVSVYRAVVSGMLRNGEPGFYNRSLAQVGEVNEVASTNPCGEIALEEFENCFAGQERFVTREYGAVSFNEVVGQTVTVPTTEGWAKADIRSFGIQRLQTVEFAPVRRQNGKWQRTRSDLINRVSVTPDHRWMLTNGEITTSLSVGHNVYANAAEVDETSSDFSDGVRHGIIFGDGCMDRQYSNGDYSHRIRLFGDKAEEMKSYFEKFTYPESTNGAPEAWFRHEKNLKLLPRGNEGPEYLAGFIKGWCLADGNERPNGSIHLASTHPFAWAWLQEFASSGGWVLRASRDSGQDSTNFGDRKNPLRWFTLDKPNKNIAWRVVSIVQKDTPEEVFCATVPGIENFTLSAGISTMNCNLGHVNLDAFVGDFEGAVEAHRLMTRFLIRATFGDVPEDLQRKVLDRNRRIGVGHFGFQGWVNKMGVRYSDSHRDPYIRKTLKDFYEAVRKEARRYAFQLRIPEPVKVTTVAPTGTIAKLAGRSEGIHPIYAKYFIRRVRYSTVDPLQLLAIQAFEQEGYNIVDDIYAPNTKVVEFPTKETLIEEIESMGLDISLVESADEIALEDMLAVQAMYQSCYADNAVSFTVNFPEGRYTVEEAAGIIRHYLPHLKGTTLMPDGTRPLAPYERISRADFELYQYTMVGDGVDEDCANGACPVK